MRRLAIAALLCAGCSCEGGGGGSGGGDGSGGEGGSGSEGGDDGAIDCATTLPPRRVRRLTHAEYDRTIRDLTGLDLQLSAAFAPDNVVDGWANDAEALTVSGLLADQYRVAAETIADAMIADLALPCDPASDGCAEMFVVAFGRRAFRRPLTDDERTRWAGLHAELVAEDGFDEAMRWVIAGMLQAPAFLYRTELGTPQDDGNYALDSYELATALSYLVVGTMPDDELAADADADLLRDPEVLQAHAVRLAARDDAVVPMRSFVDAWLRTGLLEHVTRDPEKYGALTDEIRAAMRGETHRLVDDVWKNGGTLGDLLQSPRSFLTDELAAFYGVAVGDGTPDAEGYRSTDVSAHYGGVLTHGSVLATHALPQSSSPIHRGLLVRERILCNDLPPPPPGVANEPPTIEPGVSTRERYAMHSADPTCAACHHLLDPIGFGFEHFDAIGRWRADDDGVAIDASGTIVGTNDGDLDFDGTAELASMLTQSPQVHECYARQWSTFALGGFADDPGLECLATSVRDGLVDADLRLSSAVDALVLAPGFALRRADDAVPPPSGDSSGGDDSDASSEGGDESSSSSGPAPESVVEVTVTQTGLWADGECNEVTVTNISDAAVTWEVRFTLQGTITTVWNATATPDGDETVFAGVDYNATIEPAAAAQFGYCLAY